MTALSLPASGLPTLTPRPCGLRRASLHWGMTVCTVLIVEDDECLRTSLATALANEYMVRTVGGGLEALRFLKQNTVDLILLDMVMSAGDGFTVLAQVAKMSPKPQVVILSVLDQVGTAVKAMRLGADDYLVKPCALNTVREIVRKVLGGTSSPTA